MNNFTRRLPYQTALLILAVVAVMALSFFLLRQSTVIVGSFEECRKAGGALLESYPEQCIFKGKTFTNPIQSLDSDWYVGLSETDALSRAKESNVPARVVERDGESLPVTMDYVIGRLNFSVKGGKVIKVSVEGDGSDAGN